MIGKAIPVERGCGTRERGGVYGECGLGAGGRPIEDLLVDPPIRIDMEKLGLMSVGVKLIERDGVWHVLDIVGRENYPNVADFLEEARRFGVSRRFPKNLDFSKLTAESRMLLAHKYAWVENFDEYANYWVPMDEHIVRTGTKRGDYNPCPCGRAEHRFDRHPEMCAGVWWQDVEQAVNTVERVVERRMPSFTYTAARRPFDTKPQRALAIFGTFPLHRLVVIKDPKNNSHTDTLERVTKSTLTVEVEDE